jgi:MarR-like DNA-binding transcriptional regulator SgrR of sgrS sRNA
MPDTSDPLRVRIPLRRGVFFHNGQALRISDVVASLNRARKSELAHTLGKMKAVSADSGVLIIELRAAEPELARRLSALHTAITLKGRSPSWRRLVGTGAYRLKERSTVRRELRLAANERHFAGRAYADELRLRWYEDDSTEARTYETGGSQVSMRGDIAFAGHRPKYQSAKEDTEANILVYVGLGKSPKVAAENSFRQALSFAIGRAGMKQIGSGEKIVPTVSPLPRSARGTVISSAGLTANSLRARQLLKELGKKHSGLSSLSLEIIVNKSRPDDSVIAGRVAAALFAIGIKTRLVSLHANAFARRVKTGQCDLYIGQLATRSDFAADTLRTAFVVGGFEKLLGKFGKESRGGMERQFNEHLPLIPLFHRGLRVHHRSDLQEVAFDDNSRLLFEDLFLYGLPEKN